MKLLVKRNILKNCKTISQSNEIIANPPITEVVPIEVLSEPMDAATSDRWEFITAQRITNGVNEYFRANDLEFSQARDVRNVLINLYKDKLLFKFFSICNYLEKGVTVRVSLDTLKELESYKLINPGPPRKLYMNTVTLEGAEKTNLGNLAFAALKSLEILSQATEAIPKDADVSFQEYADEHINTDDNKKEFLKAIEKLEYDSSVNDFINFYSKLTADEPVKPTSLDPGLLYKFSSLGLVEILEPQVMASGLIPGRVIPSVLGNLVQGYYTQRRV